jgi:hypothetical protein
MYIMMKDLGESLLCSLSLRRHAAYRERNWPLKKQPDLGKDAEKGQQAVPFRFLTEMMKV